MSASTRPGSIKRTDAIRMVDAHCHFDFPGFDGRHGDILRQCRALGVQQIVIPGVRATDWERVNALAGQHDTLFSCVGIHPWFVDEHGDAELQALRDYLANAPDHLVALGETGLDRLHGNLASQQPLFEAQVDIARELRLPLVIHSVRANDEVGAILRRKQVSVPCLVHGFSGSKEQARALWDTGCFLGVGGVITYGRAQKTRAAIASLPLEALVLETDAPDMPPAGVANGENSPAYLPEIFQALCALRPESEEQIAEQLLGNVARLYGERLGRVI